MGNRARVGSRKPAARRVLSSASTMRVEGGKQPAQAQKAEGKTENLEAKMKDFPKQESLIQVLRNPELRKKLEEKVGEELVGKLDKIFNAQPPGTPPVNQPPPEQAQAQAPQQAQAPARV